jgi:uncharacterized protein (DUF305 family)
MKKLIASLCVAIAFAACNNDQSSQESASGNDTLNQDAGTSQTTSSNDTNTAAGAQQPNHMKDMHDAMSGMMQQMKSMTPTKDPDQDFAMIMKHHHEGGIKMAQSEIAGGNDTAMKAKAQKIMAEQQIELAEFDAFLRNHQPAGESNFGQQAMNMMTDMSSMKMESSSLDAMFASMMVSHHQDGIKMAREYLKSGKDASIKGMATRMIPKQQKDIKELQDWLKEHK